jgi:hypothetical protein
MNEFSPAPGSGGIADRLIRRLRVSDPPERFQRRAATALREALGFEAVAWVPDALRETIIQAGSVDGLTNDGYRAMVRNLSGQALRVVEASEVEGPIPAAVRRFVVASVEGDSGRLLAVNPPSNKPSESDLQSLFSVASLISTQRANARSYSDLKDLLFGVIRALTSAIDAKDPYTSGHSERVARIAVRIGQEMGMSPHDQGDLYLMGLLHDVGKIGVDDGILKKPGRLSPEEYLHIQAHVRIGVHILSDLKKLHHLLPGVAYHHEKMDGTGYPAGLKGDAIPLCARILAAADSFDAMSSSRPYRRKMSSPQIDEELRNGAGSQWDPRVLSALFACRDEVDRIRQKGLGESLQAAISETLGRN